MAQLTPKEIVNELDKYIIGQSEAKRAVAIALRNRYRRSMLDEEMRNEVTPKNIIMMGPTGVGKTEIARRLAKLVRAPFVKVEATKFTEVGYVGRDVDSMVRDLVDQAVYLVKEERRAQVRPQATEAANKRLVKALAPGSKIKKQRNPWEALMGAQQAEEETEPDENLKLKRSAVEEQLRAGKLEEALVSIEVEESTAGGQMLPGMDGVAINMQELMGGLLPKKTKQRTLPVREARKVLTAQEEDARIDMDDVISEALYLAENQGILFIDEIDKIAARGNTQGADVSREGVQRDILPLVEGASVNTKYGQVKTDYILFIAAGAFHVSKVSDLIPELQGRFPIRVELKSLSEEDFLQILTQPRNALLKQYQALLEVDNIQLRFTDEALRTLAHAAYVANENSENLGARRLHTLMEGLLEDISFNAGGNYAPVELVIDEGYVRTHMQGGVAERELGKYIV